MKKISILMLLASSFWGMAQERPQMNDINADDVELTPVFVGMPAIATDRPDFSETAQIVPIGWLQYEAGYQFSHVEERISLTTITNTHQFEEVFRFGVNRRFEARAIINANTQHVDYTDTWNDPAKIYRCPPHYHRIQVQSFRGIGPTAPRYLEKPFDLAVGRCRRLSRHDSRQFGVASTTIVARETTIAVAQYCQ